MIEWIKCEQTPPHNNTVLIVTEGKWVYIAERFYVGELGYQWVTNQGDILNDVTHYAEINLPK